MISLPSTIQLHLISFSSVAFPLHLSKIS